MNYYEHHLGDYVRDTAHLTMLEDGAYRRLLDAYYIRERPLPTTIKEICRLVRATTRTERAAVEMVLAEFFESTPEGWRQRRCDAELRKFSEKAPEREARRQNERERQRRSRERRMQLFDLVRAHGITPAYDISMAELQALADQLPPLQKPLDEGSDVGHTPPVTRDKPVLVTRDTTAAHTPVNEPNIQEEPHQGTHTTADPVPATAAAEVCMALKQAGISQVNPGDPRLLALLARGATVANFVAAASAAREKRSPFAYLLATVDGQLTEAASLAAGPHAAIPTHARSRNEQRVDTVAGLTGSNTEPRDHAKRTPDFDEPIDVEAHVIN